MGPYLAIAIGGTLGCWTRYWLTGFVQNTVGRSFPYATLLINVLGSFVMGFLFIETLERVSVSPAARAGLLTGVIGGFTTFSTFTLETLMLMEEGAVVKAVLYVTLSIVLGLSGAFAGIYLARNR